MRYYCYESITSKKLRDGAIKQTVYFRHHEKIPQAEILHSQEGHLSLFLPYKVLIVHLSLRFVQDTYHQWEGDLIVIIFYSNKLKTCRELLIFQSFSLPSLIGTSIIYATQLYRPAQVDYHRNKQMIRQKSEDFYFILLDNAPSNRNTELLTYKILNQLL
ncbi:hypothetical protein C6370_10750 [Bacillus atrophaeus]|nr:hypothetical protein C6370_10750 [Bacillus atrophaeus]